MKKKISALILSIILITASFAACSSGKNGNQESTTGDTTVSQKQVSNEEATATQPPSTEAESTTAANPDYTGKKLIAITFDDGPGKYTYDLITELNNRGVKATFFMLGQNVGNYPDSVKYMAESGHQLGSHTYYHNNIVKALTNDQFIKEMSDTDAAIEAACGQKATAFRMPYGAFNDEKLALTDKTVTHWSVDTLDWKSKNAEAAKQAAIKDARDGSIILFHDIYQTSVQGALAAIDALQAEGYVFVTVDDLLKRNGDEIQLHKVYFSCAPAA